MKNINDFDKLIYSIIGTALFFGLVVYASYEDSGKGYDSIGFILPIIIVILSFIALFGFEIYKAIKKNNERKKELNKLNLGSYGHNKNIKIKEIAGSKQLFIMLYLFIFLTIVMGIIIPLAINYMNIALGVISCILLLAWFVLFLILILYLQQYYYLKKNILDNFGDKIYRVRIKNVQLFSYNSKKKNRKDDLALMVDFVNNGKPFYYYDDFITGEIIDIDNEINEKENEFRIFTLFPFRTKRVKELLFKEGNEISCRLVKLNDGRSILFMIYEK